MTLSETMLGLIETRSFSSIWYWLAVAVTWSMSSHWTMGVPFDIVTRARRHGGQAMADLEAITAVNVNRLLQLSERGQAVFAGVLTCFLTMNVTLGFAMGYEFFQAVSLLFVPLTGVLLLSMRLAHRLRLSGDRGEALIRRLWRHRIATQAIGMLATIVTGVWGTYVIFITRMAG